MLAPPLATATAVELNAVAGDTDLEFGNFVAPEGTDLILIVAMMTSNGSGEVTGVQYGGLTFTEAAPYMTVGTSGLLMMYAFNPGGAEIDDEPVVHYKSQTYTRKAAIYALSGAHQEFPINTYVQDNFDVAEGKELPITPTVDKCLLVDGVVAAEQTGGGLVCNETPVLIDESEGDVLGPSVGGSQYYQQATAAEKILSWGWSGENNYNYCILAIQPADDVATNGGKGFFKLLNN